MPLSIPELMIDLQQLNNDQQTTVVLKVSKEKQQRYILLYTCDERNNHWDAPCVQSTYDILLDIAIDPRAMARFLAVAKKVSGAWRNVLSLSALGIWRDDDIVRIVVGLHLGIPFCSPVCSLWK